MYSSTVAFIFHSTGSSLPIIAARPCLPLSKLLLFLFLVGWLVKGMESVYSTCSTYSVSSKAITIFPHTFLLPVLSSTDFMAHQNTHVFVHFCNSLVPLLHSLSKIPNLTASRFLLIPHIHLSSEQHG